jgi:cholesterol transport system auxiliary component
MTSFRKPSLAMAAMLLLAGCAGLDTLRTVSTPLELYTLTPKSTFDPAIPSIDQQIVVQEPTSTAAVASDRIIVQPTPFQVQYLPGARWVDRAPVLIQSLLIESYENSGRVPAVGRSQVGLRADYVIVTDIREFQAATVSEDPTDPSLEVNVRLNLKIVHAREDRIIGSESFERVELAESSDPAVMIVAFDEALGDAMRDAVEWSVPVIHRHARANPPMPSRFR